MKGKVSKLENQSKLLMICQAQGKKIGIIVDNVVSEQDIVVKNLDQHYARTLGIRGATILGNGSISLILDIAEIYQLYIDQGLEINRRMNRTHKNHSILVEAGELREAYDQTLIPNAGE